MLRAQKTYSSEQDAYVRQLADRIDRLGWRSPVLFFLEAGGPFLFFVAQFMLVIQPALGLLVSYEEVGRLATVMENPAAVSALVTRLNGAQAHE